MPTAWLQNYFKTTYTKKYIGQQKRHTRLKSKDIYKNIFSQNSAQKLDYSGSAGESIFLIKKSVLPYSKMKGSHHKIMQKV